MNFGITEILLNLPVFILLIFCKHYGIKENEKFCYIHKQFAQPQYSYSLQTIEFIATELEKDPKHILDNIKNKLTPGAKEF